MSGLLLNYLRRFPFLYGKGQLSKLIDLSKVPSPTHYRNSMGINFELHLEEYLMRQVYLFDVYERNTIRHLRNFVPIGGTCFDCGANSGFYTLTLARIIREGGQVHAFEPLSINFKRLEKNVSLNDFKGIHINQFGLSDSRSELKIFFGGSNLGSASMYKEVSTDEELIQLVPLDEYCEEKKILSADFIKIDIEGAEMECIKGAKELFSRSKKMGMVLEIMEDNCRKAGYTGEELFNKVIEMGFKAYIPKPWPFKLKPIDRLPENYLDNIVFLKGY